MEDRGHIFSIDVITPVFNEVGNLPRYVEEVKKVLSSRKDCRFRFILVDDGSQDGSWDYIDALCKQDSDFYGVRLSRNFGAHIAICAGFDHADADAVAILAADMQDPPEVVLEFLQKLRKGAQIAWGKRIERADGKIRKLAVSLFHSLLKRFAMPRGSRFTTGSFLMADRQVVECVKRFRETHRLTFALVAWTGFSQEVVEYRRQSRRQGVSGWSLARLFRAIWDGFLGFSVLPIRVITACGLAALVISFFMACWVLWSWLTGNPLLGWSSLMLALSLFFGLHFFLLGILAEYLYRIYSESVRRPLYFISRTSGEPGEGAKERR